QIIVLRFVNIGLAIAGLILAKKLLRRLGGSRALVNTALLLSVLVPIVPFLAAHINYDNLFIVLTLGSILAVFDWLDRLQRRQISAGNTALILCLFAAASLVKYAYLPIALGLGGIMLWQLWKARKQRSELSADFLASIKALRRWQLVGIGVLFILS